MKMKSPHRFLPVLACPFLLGGFIEIAQAHPGHSHETPGDLLGQGDGTLPKQSALAKIAPPSIDLSTQRTLYIVGYSHLDTQWRWTYPQVIRQFLPDTMQGNFKLFEKYPNYIFNFSGSRRYEMMREYYPADYARLKAYVTSGQWFPCGSSVDEGDSIVPGLESSVRTMLYGNQFFRREFGVESREYMLPDCFGFPAGLPTMINHAGLRGFSTQKLTWGSAIGIPFKVGNWIGVDGSSITSALDPGAYVADVKEDLSKSKYWIDRVEENGKKSGVYTDYHYYGVGDRGGAPNDASVQWVEQSAKSEGPLKIVSSRADDMFRTITPQQKKGLPSYKGELLLTEHSAGSITSQSYMKRWNRKSELLADVAESTSVAAMWLGGAPYPSKKLYDSWDLVLGSQMHDMLPGTSLPKAYEFCWNDYILAQNGFASAAQNGVDVVSAALDTRVKGIPLSIFNPLSVAREDVVEATVRFNGAAPGKVAVVGPDGKIVPSQILGKVGNNALKIAFTAKVPSVGFAVYDVRDATLLVESPSVPQLKVTANSLENERFRVRINAAGDIASVFDKKAGRETLAAPARLAFLHERPGSFPAWNMDWNDRKNPPVGYVDGPAKIRIVENGAARVSLEIERFARGSRFVQTVSLASGEAGNRVDVKAQIDWQTQVVSLKATFPFAASNPNADYDSQVGVVTRGNNNPRRYEVPQHQWFDLTGTDGKFGASVYNDSKYGSDKPDDATMRLTLLYTPGVRDEYQDEATQDFGRHDMAYSIAPHQGDWRAGNSVWGAARLNQPLRAFQTTAHAGTLGKTFSLFRTSTNQVQISSIKKAEESDEIIIRLRELHGAPAQNFRIGAGSAIISAREVDGQERAIVGAKPVVQNGVLTTSIAGYSLKAFALKLAAPTKKIAAPNNLPLSLPFNIDAASFDRDRKDGNFDDGRTYPAEEIPSHVQSEGITFRMGSKTDGANNALAARGQKISLPKGHNRVYILAAANGDQVGQFAIGNRTVSQKIQSWNGYIGSFDLRLWDGPEPELAYAWDLNMNGLVPGFTKRDTVAWQASHHHAAGGNQFYERAYMFKYGFDIPKGATQMTLPSNPNIRVFAVTVADETAPKTSPTQPLYDTLENRRDAGPSVRVVSGEAASQSVQVAMVPGLYYRPGGIRYTLDGSTPTIQSPIYREPIFISRDTTIKTRDFSLGAGGSNVGSLLVRVNDITAPTLTSAISDGFSPLVFATFSEPVGQSARVASSFRIEGAPGVAVRNASLSSDGRAVMLQLSAPLPRGASVSLAAPGVSDVSPRVNMLSPDAKFAVRVGPVVEVAQARTFNGQGDGFSVDEAALPVAGRAAWTINQWVYLDKQPKNLTILGGFGSGRDQGGQQRFLISNNNSIYFWGSNVDIDAKTPWDLGRWQMVTVTYDGQTVRIFKDGRQIKSEEARLSNARPQARLAPPSPWGEGGKFEGKIANFEIYQSALSPQSIATLAQKRPVQ